MVLTGRSLVSAERKIKVINEASKKIKPLTQAFYRHGGGGEARQGFFQFILTHNLMKMGVD